MQANLMLASLEATPFVFNGSYSEISMHRSAASGELQSFKMSSVIHQSISMINKKFLNSRTLMG